MLDKLAENHNLWLKILHKIGCPNQIAEDIVQEFYIKVFEKPHCHPKIINHEGINTYYIYAILRNMYLSHIRLGKRFMFPYIEWDIVEAITPSEEDLDIENLELEDVYLLYLKDKIDDVLESLTMDERQLYELHFAKGISQRKISRDSGVSLNFINNTMLRIKGIFRSALFEDAQDFYNQDYTFRI